MLIDLINISYTYPQFFLSFLFILGCCIGSFLNVCILRIPLNKSIINPPSSCSCGYRIPFYQNLPVISWFLLKGKCSSCGTKFSFRYPFVELFTGICFTALAYFQIIPLHSVIESIALKSSDTMTFGELFSNPTILNIYSSAFCTLFFSLIFTAAMITTVFTDIDHLMIPDRISLGLTAVIAACMLFLPNNYLLSLIDTTSLNDPFVLQFIQSILGLFIGSGILLWLALFASAILKKDAVGVGDIKLLGLIGVFIGWPGAIFSIFVGSVISLILLVILKITNTSLPLHKTEDNNEEEFPFGPGLCIAALLYLIPSISGSVINFTTSLL